MRGLLVVNPMATAFTDRTKDVLIHALADQFHLEVVHTDHRGHAVELGQQAVHEDLDVVVVLGGDGTVNETINGLMSARDDRGPEELPRFGAVPGGSANVFTRALGFPPEPVEATGAMVEALRNDRTRLVSLAHLHAETTEGEHLERWITFNAGLGIDAQIIHNMESLRAKGKEATPTRYLATTLRTFFIGTDRKHPSLTLQLPGAEDVPGVFLAIIQNTSPWTYLGNVPINPLPSVDWDSGLGVWAVRRMTLLDGLRYGRRVVVRSKAGSTKKGLFVGTDLDSFTALADPPAPLQVDGECLGNIIRATFTSHPNMLRAYA